MNEKLLEFAKLAGIKFPSETDLSPPEQKFAELILLDLISQIKAVQTANRCSYTTYDKAVADCVKGEIINLIKKTYNVKVPYDYS